MVVGIESMLGGSEVFGIRILNAVFLTQNMFLIEIVLEWLVRSEEILNVGILMFVV